VSIGKWQTFVVSRSASRTTDVAAIRQSASSMPLWPSQNYFGLRKAPSLK
jgi:hypothetical protein